MHVLIVEDDALTRKAVIRALKFCGLKLEKIFEASNGAQGLKILEEQNIDFALFDYHMPQMDGGQLMDKVQEHPDMQRLPIIFISGDTQAIQKKASIRNRCGFIPKPFRAEKLGETVMNLISGPTS